MLNTRRLSTIIFLLLLPFQLFGTPNWYTQREKISTKSIYYGYGEGRTQTEARANALREISEQINTKVSSSLTMHTTSSNQYITQNTNAFSSTKSSQTLKDIKVLKQTKDGTKYFILMKHIYTIPIWYESRSFEAPLFSLIGYGTGKSLDSATKKAKEEIALVNEINSSPSSYKTLKSEKIADNYFVAVVHKKIPLLHCQKIENNFLENIDLIQKAHTLTPCKYKYSLQRLNKRWNLYSDGWSQELSDSQFDSFFTSVSNDSLSISSEYSTYQKDDTFTLQLKSQNNGYISILAVYENGKVGILLENKKIQKYQTITFPNKDSNLELIAGLNENNEATKDLYFAFFSKSKINLSEFDIVNDQLLGEKEYRFNKVIDLCQKYIFSTILLRTTLKSRIKRFSDIKQSTQEESIFSWFFSDKLKNKLDDLPYMPRDFRKWAFIISIEDYEFSDSIKYASNDGELFNLLVQKKLNIDSEHVVYLKGSDASAKNISIQLTEILKKIQKHDTLYFYFVGQGVPVPQEKNEPYLLAYDKSVASVAQNKNLKLSTIYKTLSQSKAKNIFLFLDTTFSGATDGISVFKGVAAPKLQPKRIKPNPQKMSVFIAGKDTEFTNFYKEKRHRMFTYFLVDAIVNKHIYKTKDLQNYISSQVNKKSFELGDDYIQTPIFRGNQNTRVLN